MHRILREREAFPDRTKEFTMAWTRSIAAALFIAAVPVAGFCQPQPSSGPRISHPPEVALVNEGAAGSVYRQTVHSLRLYTYDRDTATRSNCIDGCASAWPPLEAAADSVPVGDWTLVDRPKGKRQWAFRGKPVYTHYHDAPNLPSGDGIDGVWHIVPHIPLPESPR
jgi:predicted lipoprotein with Yx(FWY)xxD motif